MKRIYLTILKECERDIKKQLKYLRRRCKGLSDELFVLVKNRLRGASNILSALDIDIDIEKALRDIENDDD